MKPEEMAGFMRGVALSVKEMLSPLADRLRSVEERSMTPGAQGERGPQGERGDKGLDGQAGAPGAAGPAGEKGATGETGPAGRDAVVDPTQIAELVLRNITLPKDGERGSDGVPGPMGEKGLAGDQGPAGPAGPAGPVGSTGPAGPQGPAGERGPPGPAGESGPAGPAGEKGAAGELGPIGPRGEKGIDGSAGLNGKDADEDAIVRRVLASVDAMVQKAISAMPQPRDGRDGLPGVPGAPGEKGIDGTPGRDGANGDDGLSLDDFDAFMKDDGRTLVIKLARGDLTREKEIRLDVPIYRGVFQLEKAYQKGDTVTYAGSCWQALSDSPAPPGDGKGWRLMVKRGADAK